MQRNRRTDSQHKHKQIFISIPSFYILSFPKKTNQKQRTQKHQIQSKFLRERPSQAGHWLQRFCSNSVKDQPCRKYGKRCTTALKYFFHQTICRKYKYRNMYPCQKEYAAVKLHAKDAVHAVDKAVHCFRINTSWKSFSLQESQNPRMMRVLIHTPIGRLLKCPIRKKSHAKQ